LSALVVEKRLLTVLMFFLVLMACGTILAILYMMVLEKRREIGILKALGAPMNGLLQLFLLNGGVIGFLGSIFGVGAALLFLRYINNIEAFLSDVFGLKVFSKEVYVFDSLPVVYDVESIVFMGTATVVFSLIAAFVPAYIAARSDPVRSLRNE
jgi:lipoprotein-releasing system permease protein